MKNKKRITTMLTSLSFLLLAKSLSNTIPNSYRIWLPVVPTYLEYYNEYPKGSLTKERVKRMNIPEEYLLAMVSIHECINTAPQDSWYIMEATWNRVQYNHGNYGKTVKEQILSPEYNGLIDKNFYFNPSNPRHCQALTDAKQIISGKRKCKHPILGWVHFGNDTNKKFLNKVKSRIVNTGDTHHKFWK